MNKKQIETLLHYVMIAMEQANQYKEMYDSMPNDLVLFYEKPLSQEEIDSLEIAHCDLELQLKNADNEVQNNCDHRYYLQSGRYVPYEHFCKKCGDFLKYDEFGEQITVKNMNLKRNN